MKKIIALVLSLCVGLVFYVVYSEPNYDNKQHREYIEFYKDYPDSVKFLTIDGDTATYYTFKNHTIKVKKTNKK